MTDKPGAHGGARPGAGRKPLPKQRITTSRKRDPLDFLMAVMNCNDLDARLRVRAAIAAARYRSTRQAALGKKDAARQAAKEANKGRFAPSAPPAQVIPIGDRTRPK